MKFKIRDGQFGHAFNLGWHWKSEKGIEWYRGDDYFDTVFFTGGHMREAAGFDCRRKVAIILEPPGYIPWCYDFAKEHHDDFDYILTYSRELLDAMPGKALYFQNDSLWLPREHQKIYPNKTKLVSIIASGRWGLANDIALRYGDRLDLFGHCGGYRPERCIEWKTEGLANYMFSIGLQNCIFDDYWTEHLTDPMGCGTIPIFYGTKNVGNYFDAAGVLRFETLEELDVIMDSLSPELYRSRIPAIEANFAKAIRYRVAEDFMLEHYPFLFDDGH